MSKPVKGPVAIIDLDMFKYAVSSVGDRRFVEVVYNPTGKTKQYNNKTEFLAHLKDKNESRLADGATVFALDDFTIIQKSEAKDPLANILHSAKLNVDKAIKASGAASYEAYIGKGESFRVGLSTLKEYKGSRKDIPSPSRLKEVSEYLTKRYDATVVTGIEVDDKIVMRYLELEKQGIECFIMCEDKDGYGCPVRLFNPNKAEQGIVDCRGFGELWLDDKGKVRGKGRMFKYFQASSQDDIDCYKANCHSDTKWGEKSAYKELVNCKTDKEAWEVMVGIFKKLYPEPKTITTWQGDEVEIDWLYVLQEMVNMAHMQRWTGDTLDVKAILTKMGIDHE